MAKEKTKLFIAFCEHSWKPFINESECISFIQKRESIYKEYWSITPGNLEFYTPYVRENKYTK